MAALAPSTVQVRRADAVVLGSDALIQRQQVGRDDRRDLTTLRSDRSSLAVQLTACGGFLGSSLLALGCKCCALGSQLLDSGIRTIDAVHDLELDVFQVGLAPGEGGELVLQALQLLGVTDRAGVHELAIMPGTLDDLRDICLGAGEIALEVVSDDLGRDKLVAHLHRTDVDLGQALGLRKRLELVRDLSEPGVAVGKLEQALLVGRIGVQLRLLVRSARAVWSWRYAVAMVSCSAGAVTMHRSGWSR